MTVRVLDATQLEVAADLLVHGLVVAIPTDTVYGLAARLDDDAIAGLYLAKGRPDQVPIAVLCAEIDDARRLAQVWPDAAARLAGTLWPGALTMVVRAGPLAPSRLSTTGGIGIRVPADAVCRALLQRTGPLAVTSANRHGASPATIAAEVVAALSGTEVVAVLDDGRRAGEVSTVLDLTEDTPRTIRLGALSEDAITSALSGQ